MLKSFGVTGCGSATDEDVIALCVGGRFFLIFLSSFRCSMCISLLDALSACLVGTSSFESSDHASTA